MAGKQKNFTWEDVFRIDRTGIPHYDAMMDNPEYYREKKGLEFDIEFMSPTEYIEEITDLFASYDEMYKEYKGYKFSFIDTLMRGARIEGVMKIRKLMQEGTAFNLPMIDWGSMGQEGRHRAVAAHLLGVEEMPVMVVRPTEED